MKANEYAEYYGFSPSWFGDEGIEAFHPYIRPIWMHFKRMELGDKLECVCKRTNAATALSVQRQVKKRQKTV